MEYQDQIIVESIKAEIKELINTAHNHEEKILPKEQNLMQRYFSTLDETQDDEQFQEELYLGHDSDAQGLMALNTSFIDCYEILKQITTINKMRQFTICDIGAGYGKLALTAHFFFSHLKIISIEPVTKRLETLKSIVGIDSIIEDKFRQSHIDLSFKYAFLYFPIGEAFEKILSQLKEKEDLEGLIVIESHGDMFPRLSLESDWLVPEKLCKTAIPRHHDEVRLYKRKISATNKLITFHRLFTHFPYISIRTDKGFWIERTRDIELQYYKENEIFLESKSSKRTTTINLSNIADFSYLEEIDDSVLKLFENRKENLLIKAQRIRRIYKDGSLELSDGTYIYDSGDLKI